MSMVVHTFYDSTVLILGSDEIADLKELLAGKEVATLMLEHHASGQLTTSWS